MTPTFAKATVGRGETSSQGGVLCQCFNDKLNQIKSGPYRATIQPAATNTNSGRFQSIPINSNQKIKNWVDWWMAGWVAAPPNQSSALHRVKPGQSTCVWSSCGIGCDGCRRKRCHLPPCGICHRSPRHIGCIRRLGDGPCPGPSASTRVKSNPGP